MNQNARGVRPEILASLERLVPSRDLFVSRDLEDGRRIAGEIVARGYDGVLLGGGDGTFVQCLSDMAVAARDFEQPLPRVGILRLGTGNALADVLGASRPTADGLLRDLRRARGLCDAPAARAQTKSGKMLPVLAVNGRLTPFAGCGLDAQILDDFAKLGKVIDRFAGDLAPKIGAGALYALTVGLRSVPRFVTTPRPEVEAINIGGPAYRIEWKTGRVMTENPIPTGAVLFRGSASLCSAATIPYYGLSMKMFPYSDAMPGKFQLRFATASAFETLYNLPAVFRGAYKAPSLHDFMCDGVELRMPKPTPVQVGGDLQDERVTRLEMRIAEQPIHVIA